MNILLFSKSELLLPESRIPRMEVCVLKSVILKYFENTELSLTINI